jgi:hypothetical protein
VLSNVGVGVALSTIDEESQRRVIRVVQPRNLDKGTRLALSSIRDLDLCALVVELSVATLSTMDGNVLDANKVLPRWGVTRNRELHPGLVPRAPVCVREAAVGSTADDLLVDFEPVAIAFILTHITRSLCHVNGQRAWVLHGGVVPQLESERVARIQLCDFGLACVGEGARVAAEVVAGLQELLGWHDAVTVLANVIEVSGELAIDNDLAPAIVGFDSLNGCKAQDGEFPETEKHFEKVDIPVVVKNLEEKDWR